MPRTVFVLLCCFALAFGETQAREAALTAPDTLAPGEFTWHPERSPSGPVTIIVSGVDPVHTLRERAGC